MMDNLTRFLSLRDRKEKNKKAQGIISDASMGGFSPDVYDPGWDEEHEEELRRLERVLKGEILDEGYFPGSGSLGGLSDW